MTLRSLGRVGWLSRSTMQPGACFPTLVPTWLDYAYCVESTTVPTVLRVGPFRFFFYANEGGEPAHVHVENSDGECKFWLEEVRLAEVSGVRAVDLRQIERLVREHHEHLMRSWDAFEELRRR